MTEVRKKWKKIQWDSEISYKTFFTYSILFILVTISIYLLFWLRGYSFIWSHDGFNQHYPILKEFRNMLVEVFKHPMQIPELWSWQIGMGGDVIGSFGYYVLGDIFAYLVVLFPADKMEFAYTFLILLRLFCVGLAFLAFAKSFKINHISAVVGSLVYVFSGYLFMSATRHPFFITPMILLPLLCLCVERVFQKKSPVPLMLVICWTLVSNFYFAYMLALMVGVYTIIRYFTFYKNKGIPLLSTIGKLILYAVTGFLMACVLFLPNLIAFLGSSRANGEFANGLWLYDLNYYLSLGKMYLTTESAGYWANLGFAAIAVFVLPFVLRYRKKYPTLFFSLLIGFVMMLFPFFGAIFNGLSSPSNRWMYALALPISIGVSFLLTDYKTLTKKDIRNFLITIVVFLCVSWWGPNFNIFQPALIVPLVLMILTFIVFLLQYINLNYIKKKAYNGLFYFLIIMLVCVNLAYIGNYAFSKYGSNKVRGQLNSGIVERKISELYGGADKKIDRSSFYRTSLSSGYNGFYDNSDANILLDVNTVNSFYSITNGAVADLATELDNSQFRMTLPLGQMDNRTIFTNMLGTTYLFARDDQAERIPFGYKKIDSSELQRIDKPGISHTDVYESKNSVPLMYINYYSQDRESYEKLTPLEKEEALSYNAIIDNDGTSKRNYKSTINELKFDTSVGKVNETTPVKITKNKIEVSNAANEITFKLKNPELTKNAEIYFYIDGLKFTPYNFQQRKDIAFAEDKYKTKDMRYSYYRENLTKTIKEDFTLTAKTANRVVSASQVDKRELSGYFIRDNMLLNGGYSESVRKQVSINLSGLGTYDYDNIKIYAVPFGDSYTKRMQELKEQAVTDLTFDTNKLSAKATATKNGVLVTTIPYTSGWKVKVDGKEIETKKVNTGFIGFPLKAGEHTIEMNYETPMLKAGMIASCLGIILFAGITILYTMKNRKNKIR
ncbi:YfhO family protein [Listeria sp. FSL L7-1517]|uniref:YfhO family protein n=1 Tax=Listeria immobilis TaxID=2713502 RepID=UPI00164D472C|nr:YfhO family protein [Listeria immobilis]MBC6298300.1 YfhO family protein [Listeria immobilis]